MRIPLFSTWRGFTAGGGLLSYYSDWKEALARTAAITGKILRGANPAEIPVEQPDRYTLVINTKTATALGIKLPQPVLIRADEVIE
jgi:putative ABC transport system substrate-binding protein